MNADLLKFVRGFALGSVAMTGAIGVIAATVKYKVHQDRKWLGKVSKAFPASLT